MVAFLQVIGVMLALGSILFLAVIFTRLLAGKTKRAMSGQYINVIETISLGLDKQIHLVKVDSQFVLIATAGKSVEFLTKLELDNYIDENATESSKNAFDFKSLFDKYIQPYRNRKSGKNQTGNSNFFGTEEKNPIGSDENLKGPVEGESFKNNLSRLKSMTSVIYNKSRIDGDDSTNEK